MDLPVSGGDAERTTEPQSRRCRARPQSRQPGDLRPTDVVGAFFVCGLAFLAAAMLCGVWQWISPWPWGHWLALHLAFVGGVSQLVLGASQFFVGAFLATDPPPRALVRAQLLVWNLGAILLAIAVPTWASTLTWVAVGLLLAGLVFWAAAIARMVRRSLNRSPWATRWYLSGCGFLALGLIAGSILAHATLWRHGDLLGAHMALNLAGWFGAAIVGTLHTFYPSLTQTRLRFPRLQGVTFGAWTGGVAALALGYAWSLDPVAIVGWLALCLAGVTLLINLVACRLDASRNLSLAARIVGAAQPFLPVALLLAAVAAISGGPDQALTGSTRVAVGTLLVAGWVGLTVLGSLLHLLAVVVRVRNLTQLTPMPEPRPRLDPAIAAVAVVGATGLAFCQLAGLDGWDALARVLLIAAYVTLGARVAVLAVKVLLRARPAI